eukprot:1894878-Pleurochrysis_carterae.AAC.1
MAAEAREKQKERSPPCCYALYGLTIPASSAKVEGMMLLKEKQAANSSAGKASILACTDASVAKRA